MFQRQDKFQSIWALLGYAARRSVVAIIGVIGSGIAIVMWWIPDPRIQISMGAAVLIFSLLIALISLLAIAALAALEGAANPLPKARSCVSSAQGDNRNLILLLDPSPFFSHDHVVSIFLQKAGNYEKFIGYGYVLNIQDNKMIQVRILGLVIDEKNVGDELSNSNATTLASLIVKPSVGREFYNEWRGSL
jgi:hypothetical protein